MIIKIRRVKHLRKDRRCDSCNVWMEKGQESVYMFGMADYGDKPYGIWIHPECVTGKDDKRKLEELDNKK